MKRGVFILLTSAALFAGGNIELANSSVTTVESASTALLLATFHKYYIGGALTLAVTRKSSVDLNVFKEKIGQDRLANITLLGGYNYNPYLSFELRLTTTIAKKNFSKYSGISFFVKPKYSINEKLDIYALLGLGYVKLSGANGYYVNVKKTAFQWGVGASYKVQDNTSLFVDYTSLGRDLKGTMLNEKKANVDALNVGITYSF